MAYDPFTQRRKIPAFPSVFAPTRVGNLNSIYGPLSVSSGTGPEATQAPAPPPLDPFANGQDDSLPEMPDASGGSVVPPFPNVPPPPGPATMPADSSPASSTDQPAVPIGDQSSADQTQRYYDRKFGRMSHDPAERMAARRIDGTAPLSPRSQIGHVSFNNEVPGHSDWQPYQ